MFQVKFKDEDGLSLIKKIALFVFATIYPLLVSMHTMLPPLIGLAGYFMIVNMKRKEKIYIVATFFYLLNLDLNLSLPLFHSLLSIFFIYMFVYPPLMRLVRCKVCLLFALILMIDFVYYILIFIYDFIVGSNTILADIILVYYIVIDIFLGILL